MNVAMSHWWARLSIKINPIDLKSNHEAAELRKHRVRQWSRLL